MDRAEHLKKYRICPQCLGEHEDTIEGLEDHIYHSPQHDNYINMICSRRNNWWEFWK